MRFPFLMRALLAGLALLWLGACKAPAPPAPPPPEVTVATPLTREIIEWDEFTGRVAAVESVEVRPRVDGYIESVSFTEGSMVKAGEVLFVIDPRPFKAVLARARAEVAAARAHLDLARREEKRAIELGAQRLIAEQDVDSRRERRAAAEAALAAAKAAAERAALDVGYCEVRAPISGRVGRRLVTAGNLVSGGEDNATLLTTIVSLDPIHVYITGDEQAYLRYLRMAREGARPSVRDVRVPARMRLADQRGWPHQGHVDFIDNQIDRATGTILGRAVFPNPDRMLTPGLFAQVQVRGAGPFKALLIPDSAIAADQARRIVFVLGEGNVAEARPVTPGRLVGALRVISTGLAAGDRVIINGQARIRTGMVVAPVEGRIEPPAELVGVEKPD